MTPEQVKREFDRYCNGRGGITFVSTDIFRGGKWREITFSIPDGRNHVVAVRIENDQANTIKACADGAVMWAEAQQ